MCACVYIYKSESAVQTVLQTTSRDLQPKGAADSGMKLPRWHRATCSRRSLSRSGPCLILNTKGDVVDDDEDEDDDDDEDDLS